MGSITFRKSHLEAVFVLRKDLQEAGAGEPGTPRPGTPQPRTSAMPRVLLGQTASRAPRRKDKSRGMGRGSGWRCDAFTLSTKHTRARGWPRNCNADYAQGTAKLQTEVRKWRNALSLRFFLLAISATCQNVGKAISGRNVIYSLKVSV